MLLCMVSTYLVVDGIEGCTPFSKPADISLSVVITCSSEDCNGSCRCNEWFGSARFSSTATLILYLSLVGIYWVLRLMTLFLLELKLELVGGSGESGASTLMNALRDLRCS